MSNFQKTDFENFAKLLRHFWKFKTCKFSQ